MQGTSSTKQERECKLYDAFAIFTHIKGKSLHNYYLRFTQMINDMNIYNMKMEQFQVNTKFLNSLPPEWSKFVTDVKLEKDLNTTNFDQLHASLEQHEIHENEVRLLRFAVPVFSLGDDLIACLNKAMACLIVVASSRFPSTNNQLRTSSNLRNQATIQDGRVIVLQEAGQILDEEQLAFLADPGVQDVQAVQTIILNNVAFQTEDLDTYDSDCDDVSNAKAVLMDNISNYGSNVISEEKANKEQSNESVTAEQERYRERVKTFKQRPNIGLSSHEKMIDSQMDDMIKENLAPKEQVDYLRKIFLIKSKNKNVYCKHSLFSKVNPKKRKINI
nr:hypothetical protein [Tanacetum cinerariifolium]